MIRKNILVPIYFRAKRNNEEKARCNSINSDKVKLTCEVTHFYFFSMISFIIYFIIIGFWFYIRFHSDDASAIESLQSNESVGGNESVEDSEKQQNDTRKSKAKLHLS